MQQQINNKPILKPILPQKINSKGLQIIKKSEGMRLQAYLCPAGVWTIGFGHTKNVKKGDKINSLEAIKLLIGDIAVFENQLNRWLIKNRIQLNNNQFSALISFCFNAGFLAFQKSTLALRIMNNINDPDIEKQFNRWVWAGKKKLPGLVKRRAQEALLYFS